jgi:hypothetical protein
MTIARLQNYLLVAAAAIFVPCVVIEVSQRSLSGLWALYYWLPVYMAVMTSYSFGQPRLSMFRLIGSAKGTMPIFYYWVFAATALFSVVSKAYLIYARPNVGTLAGTSPTANLLVGSVMALIVITLVIAGWIRLRSSVNAVC